MYQLVRSRLLDFTFHFERNIKKIIINIIIIMNTGKVMETYTVSEVLRLYNNHDCIIKLKMCKYNEKIKFKVVVCLVWLKESRRGDIYIII